MKMINKKITMKTTIPSISASVPNPSKVGSVSVKMPKSKKLPDATDKASVFFKSEDVKHPSIQKLRDFLANKSSKRQS